MKVYIVYSLYPRRTRKAFARWEDAVKYANEAELVWPLVEIEAAEVTFLFEVPSPTDTTDPMEVD